jgi:hypothetical protein
VEDSRLLFVTITDKLMVDDSLQLESKVSSIYRGPSLRAGFMAFTTEMHTIVILAQRGEKWSIRHKFKVPNLNIRKVCFYFPGINTSTTNRFKDKLFLLIHGDPSQSYHERAKDHDYSKYFGNDKVVSCPIPSSLLQEHNLYVYEYSIAELTTQVKPDGALLKNTFCLKNISFIKFSIWTNEHAHN